MCFMGLNVDSDEGIDDAARHFVVEGGGRKKVWFVDWGREDYSDLFKHAFVFCNSLNTGVVIIFGLHILLSCPLLHTVVW